MRLLEAPTKLLQIVEQVKAEVASRARTSKNVRQLAISTCAQLANGSYGPQLTIVDKIRAKLRIYVTHFTYFLAYTH